MNRLRCAPSLLLLLLACNPAVEPDPPRPAAVSVTPLTAELTALGATVRLAAAVRHQNGQLMPSAAVTWSSGAPAVATVDGSGLVTAAANGVATITATAGTVSGSATLTVAQVVESLAVTPAADTLVEADTLRLAAVAADANGHVVSETPVAWVSADTLVAVVSASGLVTGVAAGTVRIGATASGATARAEIEVVSPMPMAVSVSPDTVALEALGATAALTAVVSDQAGRVMEGVAALWTSGDTMVAVVDSVGVVTAVAEGATAITATAGAAFGSAVVTVAQVVGSVVVTPAVDTVELGDTLRLSVDAFDDNGHRVAGARFEWRSSDTAVARVDPTGLVKGAAEGTAAITAAAGNARGTAQIAVENPDRAALVALYESTDGPNWVNSENWLTDAPLRTWHGVGMAGERVSRLHLRLNQLNGPIPPELGNLTNLTHLGLDENKLTGSIPPELGSLTHLRLLNVNGNALTGSVPPELGGLTHLERLWLNDNDLTGPIPPELGKLINLRYLWLARNNLSGPIPPDLGKLTRLVSLELNGNNLTGEIPPELGDMAGLRYLDLSSTYLSGPIPDSFARLALTGFYFSRTWLCVPASLDAWLAQLENADNRVPCVPATADRDVLVAVYQATGGVNWEHDVNWLSDGSLNHWYGVKVNDDGFVTELDLRFNNLTGAVPRVLGDLGHIERLLLFGNELTGSIPPELGKLTNLRNLSLFSNSLEGSISPELGNLVNVDTLHLAGNELSGPIPPELGNLANLRSLNVESNQLTGELPPELGNLAILESLWLSGNALRGAIPPELGNLTALELLDLSGNDLTGPIPPELGKMTSLRHLLLHFNKLEGVVPTSLKDLRNARIFDFGFNRLSGPFPSELASLELEGLWVGGQPDLCAPDDPVLRAWLVSLDAHLYPCPVDSEHTALPRVILREDGNGVSLRLPYPRGEAVVVSVSDSTVVYASTSFIFDPDDPETSGRWLDLAPRLERGDATVAVLPHSDDLESFETRVTVREAVGTFGVDVVMGIPHPVGHEETMMEVVEWWEYMLDGSELPGRQAVTCVLRDEYDRATVKAVAEDFLLVTRFHPTREGGAAVGGPCDERFVAGIPPSNGGVEPFGNGGGTRIIPVLRHEMGHALGLAGLVEPSHPGLLTTREGVRYFVGANATRAYRAAGGDPNHPGVPLDGPHWPVPDVVVGKSVYCLSYESRPNAISMYALIDVGYDVDESKIIPLKATTVAEYCSKS